MAIPNTAPTSLRIGTVLRSKRMTISAADMAHVIRTMSNLYSNKLLAMIREYATNARDAMLEAGNDDPFAVTLPTIDFPFLVIEDFGIGLSADELFDVYSMYGASTKRDNEHATGMLGLGCKSAHTYCASFSICATKNGVTTMADVTKGDDGVGDVNIQSEEHTGLPNGVRITIPIRSGDVNRCRNEAEQFFFFWRQIPGERVLVDGEVPKNITNSDRHIMVDPDVYVLRDGYESKMVMAGVPYPIETQRRSNTGPSYRNDGISAVFYVEPGIVDFVPSREQVHHTVNTDTSIETAFNWLHDYWDRWISEQFEQQTLYGKLKLYADLPQRYMKFKLGTPLWKRLGVSYEMGREGFYVKDNWNNTKTTNQTFNNAWLKKEVTIVTGFPLKRLTPQHKERLRDFGVETPYVAVPDTWDMDFSTFPKGKCVPWDSVPKPERAKREYDRQPRQAKTTYEVKHGGYGRSYPEDDPALQNATTIVYKTGKRDEVIAELASYSDADWFRDIYFVRLTSKQVNKFMRLFPQAQDFDAWIKAERDKAMRNVTVAQLRWHGVGYRHRDHYTWLKTYGDQVTNTHFKSLFVPKPDDLDSYNKARFLAAMPANAHEFIEQVEDKHKQLRDQYPLFNTYSYQAEDVIIYINAKGRHIAAQNNQPNKEVAAQ